MPRLLPVLLPAALALAACGSTERSGAIGDTLEGRQVQVKLLRFKRRVKERRDVTGLGAAGRGMRLVAADVGLCNRSGQAVVAYHFTLEHTGGTAHPRYPQSALSHGFESVRDGCEHGWIVFAIPGDAEAQRLRYRFDDTGTARPGDRREEHDRFDWSLPSH